MRKNKRGKGLCCALAALLALMLTGCGADAGAITSPDGPTQIVGEDGAPSASQGALPIPDAREAVPEEPTAVTFTDALGRTVTVERPQRVVAMIGSFADVWCLAGGKETLAATADDAWTQFDLALPDTVASIGGAKDPSAEAVLAAEPDLVIASAATGADVELLPILEQAGIKTAYFDVSTFADYLAMLKICTQITGCPERYAQYGTDVQAQVDAALARAAGRQGPRVLYLRASSGSCKVKNSEGSVLGEMLAALGCENVADSDASLLEELSLEAILAADPDKIFIVLQSSDPEQARAALEASLLSNPAWGQLRAVQNDACYYLDQRLYNLKPNARWGEAYENLAEILYGDGAEEARPDPAQSGPEQTFADGAQADAP